MAKARANYSSESQVCGEAEAAEEKALQADISAKVLVGAAKSKKAIEKASIAAAKVNRNYLELSAMAAAARERKEKSRALIFDIECAVQSAQTMQKAATDALTKEVYIYYI